MTFRIGQKVMQISPWNDGKSPYSDVRFTECGVIYTIRDILEIKSLIALRFIELRNPKHNYNGFSSIEQPFPAWNFRPIVERKTDISIFEKMLAPSGKQTER